MYRRFGKRVFDVIASLTGLIILLPLLLLVSIWIKISSKGPVFYVQKRVGKDFKEFNIYKFRSMIVGADKEGLLITSGDDSRITNVGRVIRRYKIDELPQLFNVLKGDMSLVGPRPEVCKYVNLYKSEYRRVLSVRPGITDNASIHFVNEEEIMKGFEEKEKAYVEIILPKKLNFYFDYVDNVCFLNDVKIILKTLTSI